MPLEKWFGLRLTTGREYLKQTLFRIRFAQFRKYRLLLSSTLVEKLATNLSLSSSYSGTCIAPFPKGPCSSLAWLLTCRCITRCCLRPRGSGWHSSIACRPYSLRPDRQDRPTPKIHLSRGCGSDSGHAPFTSLHSFVFPSSLRLPVTKLPSSRLNLTRESFPLSRRFHSWQTWPGFPVIRFFGNQRFQHKP